jgi:hypothetical protein
MVIRLAHYNGVFQDVKHLRPQKLRYKRTQIMVISKNKTTG